MSTEPLRNLSRHSIRDDVYIELKNAIIDGVFQPGARLNLSELMEQFGISKTPLTEAIQKLANEGLVSVKPRSGTYVSDMSLEQVEESFGFRRTIEIGAAEMIVDAITDEVIADLKRLVNGMERILVGKPSSSGLRRILHLDMQFHDAIIAASGNTLLLAHYRQVNTLLQALRIRKHYTFDHYKEALSDHKRVVACLEAGDKDGYIAEITKHLDSAARRIMDYTRLEIDNASSA
ncbi:MAG: GntR family transcriptional regulator [Pseudodesulfovibrio sp.]|uniref:GntR family transcriptional regulator n=1 Tax=Pseudodesulfovibrio sp. TaxID=2035812 RepID=UPI003D0ABCD8